MEVFTQSNFPPSLCQVDSALQMAGSFDGCVMVNGVAGPKHKNLRDILFHCIVGRAREGHWSVQCVIKTRANIIEAKPRWAVYFP